MVKRTEQLCTTPRIGSSRRWERGRIDASATPRFHISRVPKCHNQRADPNLSWRTSGSFPPSWDPVARGRYREGRDGHGLLWGLEHAFVPGKTECKHAWDWLGEGLGLWEGVPRLQAPGSAAPGCWGLLDAAPGSSGGRGCDLGLFGRKKPRKKQYLRLKTGEQESSSSCCPASRG